MIWLLALALTTAQGKALVSKIGSCKSEKGAPKVLLVKQWHLAPTTITKGFRERYPQERNQTAIFIYLADKAKHKKIDLVVGEGCEGEINDGFTTKFNGWDLASLKQNRPNTRKFERILTHVPMKLEARFNDRLLTVCGDNEKLIQEGNLRLSNLRGWAGYHSKLSDPALAEDKKKMFAEAAINLLKVDQSTPIEKLISLIQDKISEELDLFKKSLNERNDSFVKTLQSYPFKTAAVVIGGLHIQDLKSKVEAAGFGCDIIEPVGYDRDLERTIASFEQALKKTSPRE